MARSDWSRTRRELLFATIILGSCATGSLGPLLVPGFEVVAADLHVSLTSVTLLNGSLVMALGVSAYVCSPVANCVGRRPVYLFTTLLVLVSCCWAAVAKSYASLIASRVFQGLGMGGFFALAGTSSINEVFRVRERGLRVGLWNFAVIVSVNLTPIVSGYIISGLSWRWGFWLEVILFGLLLAAVVFCFPETSISFARDDEEDGTFTTPTSNTEKLEEATLTSSRVSSISIHTLPRPPRQPTNHIKALGLSLIAPLALLLHPIVLWACIMWSVTFTWTILLGAVASQIFTAPPFNLSTVAVGNLTGVAPLIGSALGTVLGGWLCDWCSRVLSPCPTTTTVHSTASNTPVDVPSHTPESRLPVLLLATIAMAIGSFGLGAAIAHGYSGVVCGVFLAILNFAVGMGCTGIVAYTNDVCGARAGDAFGLAMITKSAFAFGLTFVYNDFLTRRGPLVFFATFGALSVGVMLSTVPLYVYGERIRGWADRSNLLRRGRR